MAKAIFSMIITYSINSEKHFKVIITVSTDCSILYIAQLLYSMATNIMTVNF